MTTIEVRFTMGSSGKVMYTHNILKLAFGEKNLLDCLETSLFSCTNYQQHARTYLYTRASRWHRPKRIYLILLVHSVRKSVWREKI